MTKINDFETFLAKAVQVAKMYDFDVFVCPNFGYQTFVDKIVTPISYCSNCQTSSSEQICDVSVRNVGLNTKELLLTLVQDYT